MKKTIKIDINKFDISEEIIDGLASDFCGEMFELTGKDNMREVVFKDYEYESNLASENLKDTVIERVTGTENARLFEKALLAFLK